MKMSQHDLDLEGIPSTNQSVLAHLLLKPEQPAGPDGPTAEGCLKALLGVIGAGTFAMLSVRYVENLWINAALPLVGLLLYFAMVFPPSGPPDMGNQRVTFRPKESR